jgi:predicted HAD superfamily Cof-like phosphohydrolase
MIEAVSEFHKKFGFKALDAPGFLPPDQMQVRLNFILEELCELADACGFTIANEVDGDPIEYVSFQPIKPTEMMATRDLYNAFDALLDIEYVVLGTANLMGFSNPCPGTAVTTVPWSLWREGFARVQRANMAKVRVDRVEQSKRGTLFDVRKPEGWQPPSYEDLFEDK